MSFFSIVWRNCLRRPVRAALAAGGVAVGTAAAVILAGLAWGFERAVEESFSAGTADLVVARMTTRNPMPAVFDGSQVAEIAGWDGVGAVAASGWDVLAVEGGQNLMVMGWEPGGFLWDHLKITAGTGDPDGTGILLGELAAMRLGKSVGDTVGIGGRKFPVAGIFQSGTLLENGAAILALGDFQEVTSTPGRIRHLNIRLAPGAPEGAESAIRAMVAARHRGLRAVRTGELARDNTGVQAAKAMGAATACIAFVIAALGTANSQLMNVFERESELCLLGAVGWRRMRVVATVAIEAALLSFIGGVAGVAAGYLSAAGIGLLPFMRGQFSVEIPVLLAPIVLLSVTILGLVTAFLPALRAVSLKPSAVLHDL